LASCLLHVKHFLHCICELRRSQPLHGEQAGCEGLWQPFASSSVVLKQPAAGIGSSNPVYIRQYVTLCMGACAKGR
jgi:hypothetical protein